MDFYSTIDVWRAAAQTDWSQLVRSLPFEFQSRQLPPYMTDRYAYRSYLRNSGSPSSPDRFSSLVISHGEWEGRLIRKLKSVEKWGLTPLKPHQLIYSDGRAMQWLEAWASFLRNYSSKATNERFLKPIMSTWYEFFSSSPTSPFYGPAIAGPTFFAKMSNQQRLEIEQRFGQGADWEFYTFLVIAHDVTHSIQYGAPLLSEIVLAYLWTAFLQESDLWIFQRDAASGESFNIEYPWLKYLSIPTDVLVGLMEDTANIERAGVAPYERICHLGLLMDSQQINYRLYIKGVADLITSSGVIQRTNETFTKTVIVSE